MLRFEIRVEFICAARIKAIDAQIERVNLQQRDYTICM